MNHSSFNGSAASSENLYLSAVPPANGRRALYLCAASLVRVGQFQQAERVCHDLLAQSVRFMDGKNYYASRRLLCTIGSSSESIFGNMDGRPRFLLEAESRVQFDLFCATEEMCSARWENAHIILQSLCSSLEQDAGIDEYTSFAFSWLASSIRESLKLIRNKNESETAIQEMRLLWENALENAEIAATQFEWELPRFCRESAWHDLLTTGSELSDSIMARLVEGAYVSQRAGMIREEYECLSAWDEMRRDFPNSILPLPSEWQSRWNCLGRQFSPGGGELNANDIVFDDVLSEINDLQTFLTDAMQRGNTTPQRNLRPQTPVLVL